MCNLGKEGHVEARIRAATAGKAPKAWAMPRFWVSIHSYKIQSIKKKIGGKIFGHSWLKFAMAALEV